MSDAPNTSPAFIQTVGILGQPVQLSNQVASRGAPGSNPVDIYDPTQSSYAQGNGALVESIEVMATGTMVQTVLLLFYQVTTETTPVWRFAREVFLPAVTTTPNNNVLTTSPANAYPVEMELPKIHSPAVADADNTYRGLRLNSLNRAIKWGVALGTAIASPVTVTMYGGEY